MTEEEKTILLEIDKLYSELFNEANGTWNGSYMMKPSGHNYRYKAQKLKDKIFELYNEHSPDYLTQHQIGAIAHTCDKEISYVEYHYERSIKNNAPQKRHTEFIDSMNKANKQIHQDLFSVFVKIKEIKM